MDANLVLTFSGVLWKSGLVVNELFFIDDFRTDEEIMDCEVRRETLPSLDQAVSIMDHILKEPWDGSKPLDWKDFE